MRNSLLFILAIILLYSLDAKAQCTGCTININGLSTSSYAISSGQKLCITSSGTITGLISINGGTLCNQGTINNAKVLVDNSSYFVNYGLADIDSLQIQYSNYDNYGTAINDSYLAISGATCNNYSNISTGYLRDSSSLVQNYGNLLVNFNLYVSGNSTVGTNFANFNCMQINGSFYNYFPSTFRTKNKINVAQNWYNNGTIAGGGSTCSGFNIGGFSSNSGTVGPISSLAIDICDAGSPGSFDVNSGNIANTTFCSCTNSCPPITVDVGENKIINLTKNVYPNPCLNKCITEYSETISSVTLFNELGQIVKASVIISENKVELDSSALKCGIYFMEATSASGKVNRQKFIIE